MSDLSLEALQAIHRDLVAVSEHRLDNIQALGEALESNAGQFEKLLDKTARSAASREAVNSGSLHDSSMGAAVVLMFEYRKNQD